MKFTDFFSFEIIKLLLKGFLIKVFRDFLFVLLLTYIFFSHDNSIVENALIATAFILILEFFVSMRDLFFMFCGNYFSGRKTATEIIQKQFIDLNFPKPNENYEHAEMFLLDIINNELVNIDARIIASHLRGEINGLRSTGHLFTAYLITKSLNDAVNQYRKLCSVKDNPN